MKYAVGGDRACVALARGSVWQDGSDGAGVRTPGASANPSDHGFGRSLKFTVMKQKIPPNPTLGEPGVPGASLSGRVAPRGGDEKQAGAQRKSHQITPNHTSR